MKTCVERVARFRIVGMWKSKLEGCVECCRGRERKEDEGSLFLLSLLGLRRGTE